MRYRADQIPKQTLSLKYLRMILGPAELEDLLRRYVAAKQKELMRCKECGGTGTITIVDMPARQYAGDIRDEESHEEPCEKCAGTGKKILKA